MNAKLLGLAVIMLALAGCESMSDTRTPLRERIAGHETPHVKTFAAEPRATYDAVKKAAATMGYRFVRGGPAQGQFEAITGVGAGDTPGSARQISMKVQLKATLDGKSTDVSVRLSEIIEADSTNRAGMATETPLRDTPQYEVLFHHVGEALGLPASEAK